MKRCMLFIPLLIMGCVVLPDDTTEWGVSEKSIEFYGLAVAPNEIVEVQALDASNDEWVTVATTRSASDVTHTIEGVKLYEYSTMVSFDNTRAGKENCFFGYSSSAGCISKMLPKLRAYLPNINWKKRQRIRVSETFSNTSRHFDASVLTMQWNW